MTKIARYRPAPANWPRGMKLRIVALSDIHADRPWMPPSRIRRICAEANALAPDIVVLLGDFVYGARRYARPVPPVEWAEALAALRAPLGVHAVLGNHDWWEDAEGQRSLKGPVESRRALEAAGIPVYENDAKKLGEFWLAGVADQRPLERHDHGLIYDGPSLADLPKTLAQVTDDAPVILMQHEPDLFPEVPPRVALTLAGHTHAGQIRLPFLPLATSSRFGERYAYGHIREEDRDMIVSAGLGFSDLPLRINAPAEIVLVELGEPDAGE